MLDEENGLELEHRSALRIGIVVPASNTIAESEFHAARLSGVAFHTARVTFREATTRGEKVQTIREMNQGLSGALRQLLTIDPSLVAFACTSASFAVGADGDHELHVQADELGVPKFLTTAESLVAALDTLNVSRVAIATPYIEELTRLETEFFETLCGVRFVASRSLGIIGNLVKGRLPLRAAYEAALAVDSPAAEAVLLSCTNWPTIGVLARLEEELKKPVVSSNQALLWSCMRCLGLRNMPSGLGKLAGLI